MTCNPRMSGCNHELGPRARPSSLRDVHGVFSRQHRATLANYQHPPIAMECERLTLCRESRPHPMPRPQVGLRFPVHHGRFRRRSTGSCEPQTPGSCRRLADPCRSREADRRYSVDHPAARDCRGASSDHRHCWRSPLRSRRGRVRPPRRWPRTRALLGHRAVVTVRRASAACGGRSSARGRRGPSRGGRRRR